MKKLALSVFVFLFIIPVYALADDNTSSGSSVEVRIQNRINTNEAVKQEIQQRVESKKEQIRERISANRRERIRSYFARAVTRTEALIGRLNNIIARLESRVVLIEENGENIDVSIVRGNIAKAKAEITSASMNLTESKNALESVLASEEPKDSFSNVVKTTQAIKKDLVDAHKILVSVIGDLK